MWNSEDCLPFSNGICIWVWVINMCLLYRTLSQIWKLTCEIFPFTFRSLCTRLEPLFIHMPKRLSCNKMSFLYHFIICHINSCLMQRYSYSGYHVHIISESYRYVAILTMLHLWLITDGTSLFNIQDFTVYCASIIHFLCWHLREYFKDGSVVKSN